MSGADRIVSTSPKLPGIREAITGLRGTTAGLVVGILALGALFHAEVYAAVTTWIDSTAYNHCFLVVPIVAFLIWDRRGALRGLAAAPVPWVAVLGLPLAVVWLMAERLGIMEGRQLIAVTFLEILFLGVFGWRLWWALSGPLLYLYFLVPFGEFLTPKLQDVTTVFVRHGLEILGIPAYIDGYIIEIPAGTFYVAEACAGLRFLIASIAFGCLYALMMYRSPMRRILFVLASIIVPIIANGFRALGIVGLGQLLGSAEAAATDHILYGWIFFSIVILSLLGMGLPFREDNQPDVAPGGPPPSPASRVYAGGLATLALIAAAAISPATAEWLNHAARQEMAAPRPLDPGPGCVSEAGTPPVRSRPQAGGGMTAQRITCGPTSFNVYVEMFSPRSTSGPIVSERRRIARPPDVEDLEESWLSGTEGAPRVWRLVKSNQPAFLAAISVWIDGEPTAISLAMRAHVAWTSVMGTRFSPMVVTISPDVDWDHVYGERRRQAEATLSQFVLSHPDFVAQIREQAARPAQ